MRPKSPQEVISFLNELENTLLPLQNGDDDGRFFLTSKILSILDLISSLKKDFPTIQSEDSNTDLATRINTWWTQKKEQAQIPDDDYRCKFIAYLKSQILQHSNDPSNSQPPFSIKDLVFDIHEITISRDSRKHADYFKINSVNLIKNNSDENPHQNILIIFKDELPLLRKFYGADIKIEFLYRSIFSHSIFQSRDTPNLEANRFECELPFNSDETKCVEIAFPESVDPEEQINQFLKDLPKILEDASNSYKIYMDAQQTCKNLIGNFFSCKIASFPENFKSRAHWILLNAVSQYPYAEFDFAELDAPAKSLHKRGLLERALALPTRSQNEWEEFRRDIINQEILLLKSCSEPGQHKAITVKGNLKLFERQEIRRISFTQMGVWDYFYDSNLAKKKEEVIAKLGEQLALVLNNKTSGDNLNQVLDQALKTWKEENSGKNLETIKTHRTFIGKVQGCLFGRKTASEEAIEKLTQLWRESTP